MSSKIRKRTIQLSILYREGYDWDQSLEDILVDCDMGPIIAGNFEVVNDTEVTEDQVVEELMAIGNSGDFFEVEEESE